MYPCCFLPTVGTPRRQGLCSHIEFPPTMGTPKRHALCRHTDFPLLWGPRENILISGEVLHTKHTKRGPEVVVVEADAPPPLKRKASTPSPKRSKVAPQPPLEALDVEALGASVATHVTDACQVLVEQVAATGVEAALAKGQSADHKSALAKAEKVHGNTQRALDQALNLAAKRGEQVETVRGSLREAKEGRRKAEVEAAALRVEVEALQRRGEDLLQRLGVAEAQVRSLTSTLRASFTAQQGPGAPGVQSQGSGSRSGSQ